MAGNAVGLYWEIDYGEISENKAFRILRKGASSPDAVLPIASLSDFTATATAMLSQPIDTYYRGAIYQGTWLSNSYPYDLVISYLSYTQVAPLLRFSKTELADLVSTLGVFTANVSDPEAWDSSPMPVPWVTEGGLDDAVAGLIGDPGSAVSDELSATYSPVKGANIPRLLARLRSGEAVTVGVFGDSKMDPGTTGNMAGDAVEKMFDLLAWSDSTVTIVNEAESGHTAFRQTTEGNLAAIIAAVPDAVIFEIGTNDSNSDQYGNYAAGYPMADSLAAVERACAYIRDANEACEFVIVGTTPYLPASTASNAKIRDYNTGIRALAATLGAEYIDGYGAFTDYGADWSPLLLDSTHRNADGNDVLAAAMLTHFPEQGSPVAASLAPRATYGRYDITRVDEAAGAFGFITFAAAASTADGSYALTGSGWSVVSTFDVTSTASDAFVLTGTRAVEFHVNVDLNDVAGGAGAVVDVYLDDVLQDANVDLHAQSSKNSTNYWVPFITGLDGDTHALKLVLKSGTLRIQSSRIAVAPEVPVVGIPDLVRTVNVAAAASTTTLTTSYQNLLAATSVPLPTGWGGMDIQVIGRVTFRNSGATTADRRIDVGIRENGTSLDATKSVRVPTTAATATHPDVWVHAIKKGLTAAASIDIIAKVDNATDTIQALSWLVDAVLIRTS